VEILDEARQLPTDYDLDREMQKGFGDFMIAEETLQLELRCADYVIGFLRETPLSIDQTISAFDDEGYAILRANLNDTKQLRWWLLSQGAGVEVLQPAGLRDEMREQLRTSLQLYQK